MKNLARLSIFFSVCFTVIFMVAAGIRFLSLYVEWARNLPQKPVTFLTLLIDAARWALSLAMYSSILLGLSYAARRDFSAPITLIGVIALSMIFNFGISLALHQWKNVPPAQAVGRQMGEEGLILSNSLNRNETAVILLRGMAEPLGPRVTAIPDMPLFYQESTANTGISLPPIPFGDDTPWFLRSLFIDIRLNAEQFQQRFGEGFLSYFAYAGTLIFFLTSIGFIIKFSVWPLANVFMGALVFRGILAMETFFNSPEMQDILGSFFKNIMPAAMAVPLIFFGFSLMVHAYSFLVHISKRRGDDES